MGRSGGRRDGQYCENIPCQSSLSSHLASPDLVDIEPAGCPAAAPGVVVLGPQVVAGQRGVEHDSRSLSGLKYILCCGEGGSEALSDVVVSHLRPHT